MKSSCGAGLVTYGNNSTLEYNRRIVPHFVTEGKDVETVVNFFSPFPHLPFAGRKTAIGAKKTPRGVFFGIRQNGHNFSACFFRQ